MIRPYRDDDLAGLLDVWYRASLVAHAFLDAAFFDAERKQIAERWLPMSETAVYEKDAKVVGFLSLIGHEVGAIFVDPDHQGRGIGTALLNRARESHPVLELNVFEANASGRAFYEKYGFNVVRRHTNEATGQAELRLRFAGSADSANPDS